MSAYTTDTLIADIRTAAMLPSASTTTFSDADILALANREIQSKMVPLVVAVQESYWDFDATAALVQDSGAWSVGYRIPTRAVGGKLRQIVMLDPNNAQHHVSRLSNADVTVRIPGFVVKGGLIYFYNPWGTWNSLTVQMTYSMRPGTLVPLASAGQIASIDSPTQVTITGTVSGFGTGSGKLFDLIRGVPGFDTQDIDRTAGVSTTTVTMSDLPNGLAVGDFVTLAGESPVPQIPVELHPLLIQRTVARILEAIGDREGMAAAMEKAKELEEDARLVLSPRVDGEAKRATNRSSPFRRRMWPIFY